MTRLLGSSLFQRFANTQFPNAVGELKRKQIQLIDQDSSGQSTHLRQQKFESHLRIV